MLSPHTPSLDSLELLLAIAGTGSLAQAAAARGVSQASVSMRVRTIERTVGLRLVERGPRGSRLTTAGGLLADWARTVLDAAEQLDAGITALREGRGAQLRLAASLTIAEHLLPGWLGALQQQRPELAVSLTATNSSAVTQLVLDGRVELGFVEGPRVAAGLASRLVGRDELVLVCAPGSALARRARRPVAAAELQALPLVEREIGSGTRAWLDAALGAHDRPRPLLEVSSTSAVRASVLAGIGPAVMSSLAVGAELADGRLRAVPVEGVDLRRDLRAVWPRTTNVLGPARDLLLVSTPGRPKKA